MEDKKEEEIKEEEIKPTTPTPEEPTKEEIPKKKRKNVKRKHLFEKEEKQEEEKEEEKNVKRVKITKNNEDDEDVPSFWKGGFVKPILLAGLASASFYVNHMYKTTSVKKIHVPQKPTKKMVQPVKNTTPKKFASSMQGKRSIVPGFSF